MPMTNFSPAEHGFKFNNQFVNDFIPALDYRTGGLCGGMSYAALDYYNTLVRCAAELGQCFSHGATQLRHFFRTEEDQREEKDKHHFRPTQRTHVSFPPRIASLPHHSTRCRRRPGAVLKEVPDRFGETQRELGCGAGC